MNYAWSTAVGRGDWAGLRQQALTLLDDHLKRGILAPLHGLASEEIVSGLGDCLNGTPADAAKWQAALARCQNDTALAAYWRRAGVRAVLRDERHDTVPRRLAKRTAEVMREDGATPQPRFWRDGEGAPPWYGLSAWKGRRPPVGRLAGVVDADIIERLRHAAPPPIESGRATGWRQEELVDASTRVLEAVLRCATPGGCADAFITAGWVPDRELDVSVEYADRPCHDPERTLDPEAERDWGRAWWRRVIGGLPPRARGVWVLHTWPSFVPSQVSLTLADVARRLDCSVASIGNDHQAILAHIKACLPKNDERCWLDLMRVVCAMERTDWQPLLEQNNAP